MNNISNIKNINKTNKTVVFVCTGNTCRSPMAEYYFNSVMKELNKDAEITAVSRGLFASPGLPMSMNAKKTLVSNNIIRNIGDILHMSKQIDCKITEEADFIYGITESHAKILKENFPQFASKISAMPENIGDPYGGTPEVYEECFEKIRKAVDILIADDIISERMQE